MAEILKGQCLFDIAIQETGTVENTIEIAVGNNMSVTDMLVPLANIDIPDSVDMESKVYKYYKALNLKPASDTSTVKKLGGIGYMGIEIDFIVS